MPATATATLAPRTPAPPSLTLLALEPMRGLLDWAASYLHRPIGEVGDGHPVVVYPGLGAGAPTTARLRDALEQAGFEPHDWGFGLNRGPRGGHEPYLRELTAHVRALHADRGERVSLVGWSLGGIYAREIAKRVPRLVRRVITLGTPFNAPPESTHALRLYRVLGGRATVPVSLQRRLREAPPVPTTSIFSKTDGVVPWAGCIQHGEAPHCENVEISAASHLGLANHPSVIGTVIDRLARP